jgi:LacI family transcriptional regulator
MPRITLQHIADHLQLSRSAVSRGLRHDPSIPLSTRKRIQEASARLGYRSDPLLSELASARWDKDKTASGTLIAFIDCIRSKTGTGLRLGPSAREQASFLGYNLEIIHREEFSDSSRLQRLLINRGISHLILGPIFEEALTVKIDWSKFICVQLLPGLFQLPLHSVVRDHFNTVVLAWRKAVSRGYRRIGIVLVDHPGLLLDDVMRSSAVHACHRHFFPDLPRIAPFYHGIAGTTPKAFVQWLKVSSPDVIIGFSDLCLHLFRSEFGYEIPYICLHKNIPGTAERISGINEDAQICAKEAVNLLHFCRRTYQWGIPKQRIDHVVEPTWSEGETLPLKQIEVRTGRPEQSVARHHRV